MMASFRFSDLMVAKRTEGFTRRWQSQPASFILLLLGLGLFLEWSSAQQDPVADFCRRFGHQTAVIDSKLYIDGGLVNFNPLSQNPTNYSNRGLLYQDLELNGADGMPQLYANLTKNSSIPDVSGGALWEDNVNKRFYRFGGEFVGEPPTPFVLYGYDVLNDAWDSYGAPPPGIGSVSYGAGIGISERGEGYYYGGWLSNSSMPDWAGPSVATNGLIKYEMDQNTWTNNTGPDDLQRAGGSMVYIPASDGGMLVYFGGVVDQGANGTYVGQRMDEIFLYDLANSKWYTQTATGTVPGERARFCAGAAWSPDQSSYNIYLYGGAGMPPNTAGFDDVYVLTLPTFTWIKLYPTDGNVTGPSPHHSLTCNVVKNAQMLVIGGTFPTVDSCDSPNTWGTHNVDLGEHSNLLWDAFEPNLTAYALPSPILSVVGGSPTGGAVHVAPVGGFADADLSVLMTRKASIATRTPTRAIPSATGSLSSGSGPSLSTGAIAGIAVGGSVALIAVLLGFCCFVRRHRRRRLGVAAPSLTKHSHTFSESTGPWSPHTPSGSPYTPASMTRVTPQQAPAELSAMRAGAWKGREGITWGLMPESWDVDHHRENESPLTDLPQPEIDEDGRMWVPQVGHMHVPPRLESPQEIYTARPHSASPRQVRPLLRHAGRSVGTGSTFRPVASPGLAAGPSVPPRSPYRRPMSPQELDANDLRHDDIARMEDTGQADPRPGRLLHQTYYHA